MSAPDAVAMPTTAPAEGPALVVEDLRVTFVNGHAALRGVSFELPAGQALGVVGSSGCGKTTLLRAILGLLPATTIVAGRIRVGDHDLLSASAKRMRALRGPVIGYVAQDPYAACDPLRRVGHHVEEAWRNHGETVPPGAVALGLADVGIDDAERRARQYPHQWSGGMLQRATTLAATAHDPLVTLADEPTSALDADLADNALELLRRTCSALLLVSHDLALIARHTDAVIVLSQGRIIESASSARVMRAPEHLRTRQLIAASIAAPLDRPGRIAPSAEPVLRLSSVARSYRAEHGDIPALREATLDVGAGEIIGIIGPSGSGKSTLLRVAGGLERPDAGQVRLGERTLWSSKGERRPALPRRGYVMPVFQNPVDSLDPRWPLWRTITEPLLLSGRCLSRRRRKDRARAELAAVGLSSIDVGRLPGSLSVGQCQRVAIVRALIAGPSLVIADEPTASLDVEAAAGVASLLRSAADRGAAVLVVSHDEARLRSYADRVLRMRDGMLSAIA